MTNVDNPTTQDILVQALTTVLAELGNRPEVIVAEEQLIWRRDAGKTSWTGSFEPRPTLSLGWDRLAKVGEAAQGLNERLLMRYPKYLGLVGTSQTFRRQVTAEDLLRSAVGEFWRRTESLHPDHDVISAIAADTVHFLETDHIEFACLAPLINFSSDAAGDVAITDRVVLRRLSDEEVTDLRGGRIHGLLYRTPSMAMPEWACVVTLRTKLLFGDDPQPPSEPGPQDELNRIVVAMRTFQTGPVGYEGIHFKGARYYPLMTGASRTFGLEYVPLGTYALPADQVAGLAQHIQSMLHPLHPALEVAAARLSAAEVRLDPRDRIIDSVIGMEAILLSAVGGQEAYRGELRFRFAMNYAVLQPKQEQPEANKLALSLYDLRSTIAHGGTVKDQVKWGSEKKPFGLAAQMSCEVLRTLIKRFASEAPRFGPSEKGYWETLYFT